MKNLLIIGKNSFYYNQVKDDLKKYFNIIEISHTELTINTAIMNIQWDLILIFARIKNIDFFNFLKINYKSKNFVLISSIILDLPTNFKYYSYYKEKYNVEEWFTSIITTNLTIIRSGTIETELALIYTKKNDFITVLTKLENPTKIISLPLFKKDFKIPHLLYRLIFKLQYGYIYTRPFDLIYKHLEGYVYGYIYAIEINIKPSKHF